VSCTSRQIASEAVPEPPGLSTRSTTARTDESSRAARSPWMIVSEPATLPNGPSWLSPGIRSPTA
jgi:hypothetical protein